MNLLPLIQHLPHALTAIRPDDGHMGLLATLAGMAISIKVNMARQQSKVRREKFIRERQALRSGPPQDNEPR